MSEWTQKRRDEMLALAQAEIDGHYSAERSSTAATELAAALLDALAEEEGYREAFDDVMDALSSALDGDDMYSQRPAELVWKLRDQRDEADRESGILNRRVKRLEAGAETTNRWLRKAKADAGYDERVSFDVVWEAALAALLASRSLPTPPVLP